MTQIPSEGPEQVSMRVYTPVLSVCVVGQIPAADLRHLPLSWKWNSIQAQVCLL